MKPTKSTLTRRIWHDGPPPFPGWWNASFNGMPEVWRWWNGKQWGRAAFPHYDAVLAAQRAKQRPLHSSSGVIRWTDYYPKDARVPRVDPRQGKGAK